MWGWHKLVAELPSSTGIVWLTACWCAAVATAGCCLLQGEYIAVEKLEAIYKKSPSVEQVSRSMMLPSGQVGV